MGRLRPLRLLGRRSFAIDALEQALHECPPLRPRVLVHHSDRGVQYVWIASTERLTAAGIELSIGSAGDSFGDALAETLVGLFKTEVIRPPRALAQP